MMLGQLGDVISWEVQKLLLIAGGASPLVAYALGALWKELPYLRRHWLAVLVYYILLGALLAAIWLCYAVSPPGNEPLALFCSLGSVAIIGGPIMALVLVARMVSLPRYPKGHCQNCGYDLTGNISGRCPECGEVVPARDGSS